MSIPANFKTAISSRDFSPFYWVEIEGIPDAYGTVSKNGVWFGARAAAEQFLSIQPFIRAGSVPLAFDAEVDLLADAIAKSVGQVSFELADVDGFFTTLTGNAKKSDWVYLAADITTADATLSYTGDGSAFPGAGTLYIGAETITYTGHNGGTKQFTGCSRGRYRSKARAFGRGFPVSVRPYTLKGRRCWYYQAANTVTLTAVDADKALRFAGTVENYRVHDKDAGAYVLVVQSLERALDKPVFRGLRTVVDAGAGIWGPNATSGARSFSDGAKTIADTELRNDDARQFNAGEHCLFRVDDELLSLARQSDSTGPYFWLVHRAAFGTLKAEHRPGFSAKEVAWFGPYDDGTNGANVMSATGRFSSVPTTASPLPAHHPLIVLLQLLLSTGTGTNTPGGGARNYDVLPAEWGLGIDYSRIDVAGIEKLANSHPDLRSSAVIEQEVNFTEFARRLLRPYGFYAINQLGDLWTIREVRPPLPDETARTLDSNTRINKSSPGWDANLGGVVQEVVFKYARNVVGGQYTQVAIGKLNDVFVYTNGEGRRITFEMPYTYGQANTTGKPTNGEEPNVEMHIQARADAIRQRYARPPPIVNERVDFSWLDVEPGDIVALTHGYLPDAGTAARGLNGVIGQVLSKKVDERSQTIGLTIELTGYNIADYRFIAPTLEVESNPAANQVVVKANAFTEPTLNGLTQSDLLPRDSNGQSFQPFAANTPVRIWAPDWSTYVEDTIFTVNTGTRTVEFFATDVIDVGSRITFGDYNFMLASGDPIMIARFAFMANSLLSLGAGDPPHRYFP